MPVKKVSCTFALIIFSLNKRFDFGSVVLLTLNTRLPNSTTMKQISFQTNLNSPLGIQRLKQTLEQLGITRFSVDFINHSLEVFSEWIAPERIAEALKKLDIHCQLLAVK